MLPYTAVMTSWSASFITVSNSHSKAYPLSCYSFYLSDVFATPKKLSGCVIWCNRSPWLQSHYFAISRYKSTHNVSTSLFNDCIFWTLKTLFVAAKGQGISRDDVLLHVDNTDSTLLHLAVESGVAKVYGEGWVGGEGAFSSVAVLYFLILFLSIQAKLGWMDGSVGGVKRFMVLFCLFLLK